MPDGPNPTAFLCHVSLLIRHIQRKKNKKYKFVFLVLARTWPTTRLSWKHPISEPGNAADSSWTSLRSWRHWGAQNPQPGALPCEQTPDCRHQMREREGSWLYCCCWATGKELGRGKMIWIGRKKSHRNGWSHLSTHTRPDVQIYIINWKILCGIKVSSAWVHHSWASQLWYNHNKECFPHTSC